MSDDENTVDEMDENQETELESGEEIENNEPVDVCIAFNDDGTKCDRERLEKGLFCNEHKIEGNWIEKVIGFFKKSGWYWGAAGVVFGGGAFFAGLVNDTVRINASEISILSYCVAGAISILILVFGLIEVSYRYRSLKDLTSRIKKTIWMSITIWGLLIPSILFGLKPINNFCCMKEDSPSITPPVNLTEEVEATATVEGYLTETPE
jgi:hypothetical protein